MTVFQEYFTTMSIHKRDHTWILSLDQLMLQNKTSCNKIQISFISLCLNYVLLWYKMFLVQVGKVEYIEKVVIKIINKLLWRSDPGWCYAWKTPDCANSVKGIRLQVQQVIFTGSDRILQLYFSYLLAWNSPQSSLILDK